MRQLLQFDEKTTISFFSFVSVWVLIVVFVFINWRFFSFVLFFCFVGLSTQLNGHSVIRVQSTVSPSNKKKTHRTYWKNSTLVSFGKAIWRKANRGAFLSRVPKRYISSCSRSLFLLHSNMAINGNVHFRNAVPSNTIRSTGCLHIPFSGCFGFSFFLTRFLVYHKVKCNNWLKITIPQKKNTRNSTQSILDKSSGFPNTFQLLRENCLFQFNLKKFLFGFAFSQF